MYNNSKIAKSVRYALLLGASSAVMSGATFAQEQEAATESAATPERIQVTGSRIQRTDMEGALPVTVIDRDAIDMSGENSITDVIRNTTFNTSGSFRPQSGNASGATASVNMRGLGADRTLVLVDGRRLPTSPLTGSSQDLNVVPIGMVERIEILSDGASAMYGSDAIGGVINIITRREFNGVELRYGESTVSLPSEGGDREEGSVVFGSSSDTTRLIGGVSWNNRDIIYNNAQSWVDLEPWSGYGNNWTELTAAGRPGSNATSQAFANACGGERMPFYFIRDNPNTGLDGCSYQHTAVSAEEAAIGNQAIFLKADHDINQDWNIFFNSSLSRSKYFGRYAPTLNDPGDILAADSINNPTNPLSPIFQETQNDGSPIGDNRDVAFFHRTAAIGNRDTESDLYTRDFHLGVDGRIGNVDVDGGIRRTVSKNYDFGRGYLLRSALRDAANITVDQVEALGPNQAYYRLDDPFGMRYEGNEEAMAAHQAIVNSMNVTTSRVSEFRIDEVYASAAFDLFDLNAGTVQAVVGAEYREETYVDRYDSLSEAGVVGGSSGSSAGGDRDVTAAYFETLIPVTLDLELTVAGRFDDYSDYGSDFSPKVGFRWQPLQELVVRGSWGEGFRAPSLDILTMMPSSGNPGIRDYVLCQSQGISQSDCPTQQVRQTTIANPELSSESSSQWSIGVAYQPTDWLNMTLDYYNIEINDTIRLFGAQTMIDRELDGTPIPDGLGIVREGGIIQEVTGGYANDGTQQTDGIDFNIVGTFDFGEMGRLRSNLQWSHVFELTEAGQSRNIIRDQGRPQDRVTFNNVYSWGDFDFGWNVNLIGSTYAVVSGSGDNVTREGSVGSWVTHDLQVSYNTAWDGRLTVGARNAFEKEPQLVPFGVRDYNMNLYDAYGRIMYFRYTQRF
ncbi:TonB-dependent receptor plug domain-containing protein [Aliidiomarina maris]|uniref:Iron complex outermembrane receptor protein n=1 Tax=Aliidiomarina maris TaxID=531312 RepID=A0A327X7J1_9GAMM|nr:TonB-dependent receptor [Aliidiomarina maris]RAK01853.1 iron complex outermembrane receptor protein [Aliidiomarina maris]RUO28661.1 TonB-dependent receptor [Aliidiomarina maris]